MTPHDPTPESPTFENATPRSPGPTPRSPRRLLSAGVLLVVAAGSAALGVGGSVIFHHHKDGGDNGAASPAAAQERWQCPMHPSVVQDHPGDCPICGMKLVKVAATPPASGGAQGAAGPQAASGAPPAKKGERKIAFYRNPMGTGETSPVPRKDSMGMDFIPVYEDELNGSAAAPVNGLAAVDVDPARQQLIGLRTAPVEEGAVGGAWRTSGRVAVDEGRVHHVNLKVGGFITHAQVQFVGQAVKKGDPLFSLYSPELLAAEDEYLLALRTRDQLRKGGADAAQGEDLVAAARRKLELWDVPEQELRRIEQTGQPVKDFTFYAPHAGIVTKRDALPGMRVNAGDMPIEMVDLSRVWVLADVYESELSHVSLGMPATLTLKAYPNRTFRGRVAFIAPVLNPATRTVTVRLEFPNPTGELKPEMFGEAVLQGEKRKGLRIPTDAVIDSGTEKVVFVTLGDGKFQPRQVQLGETDGDHVEVVKGLSAGEQVVTRANFLIDSESRLKASLATMAAPASTAAPDRAGVGAPSVTGSAASPSAPGSRPAATRGDAP
jgi:membrane fusion protein, copper/silver efflux system